MDTLVFKDLWLDQDVAGVLALVQLLLHVQQLQSAVVLECSLSVIEGQQVGVLVPLDGVVRVTDDVAVDVRVPAGDGSEILHGAYVSRTWREGGRKKRRREKLRKNELGKMKELDFRKRKKMFDLK